ncbi:NAD(P)-dependent oxidoreductase [Clostridium sp.]|uniref:NAD(P)-dependent oxidoreductase n=1 Tax=Clostridium sp. TaxID=1506 RepID=UPI003995D1C8
MTSLLLEAERCLLCKKPRCKSNCPINTPIPKIMKLYKENKLTESGSVLFENNPLSIICSVVCPHDEQCKGNCVKGINGQPISFPKIEYEISLKYLKSLRPKITKKNGKRIAIVGSGPAGITVAIILAKKGYNITIFEKKENIGGVLKYGIPEFRLSREILDYYEEYLINLGVKIRFNTLIGKVITINKIFNDGYSAIFIGTGVWDAKTIGIKGESLGNVHYAIDYLKNPKVFRLGEKVNIIGAGNVAIDAARSAIRCGVKEVNIFFRDARKKMEANKIEIDNAEKEGVNFNFYKNPIEILDEGVIFSDVVVKKNKYGNSEFKNIPNSARLYLADSTIIAIGQRPRNNITSNTEGLNTTIDGLIITDKYGYTSRKGVFACGDVVNGSKTVVEAINEAKIVATSIDEFCKDR